MDDMHIRTDLFDQNPVAVGRATSAATMSVPSRRVSEYPVRLTLASTLDGDLDGAWWPYTVSMARELPDLVGALSGRVGEVLDIAVNWSSLESAPDLNPLRYGATTTLPGQKTRHHRVITVTGRRASANILVVPARTRRALAVMVLRQAAHLSIQYQHLDTPACRIATAIVHTARIEGAQRAAAKISHTTNVRLRDEA